MPILLALVTVPILISSAGIERFGVIVLAWVVLGYLGLFDLGLGRAIIKFLAEVFEEGRMVEARALFWTSLALSALFGLVDGGVLALITPILVNRILNIPGGLLSETMGAFYLLALALPLVTTTAALRGVIEARQRFGLLNVLQVPTSSLVQAAPLFVLPFGNSLIWLVGSLVVGRLVGTVVFLIAAVSQFERPFEGPFFARKSLGPLFSFGGWLTVSNVISPLMVYLDRFVIGALSSVSAVAYYATPYEAVTRVLVLPANLTRTVFPIFSAGNMPVRERTLLYTNALKYLALILAPVLATVVLFAPELLGLWIGEAFADRSTAVLRILSVGVFVNSLALVPFTLVQGLGRPDLTAKLHLAELVPYLLLLWYGVHTLGIVGAALAWTVRVAADALLLGFYARRMSDTESPSSDAGLYATLMLTMSLIVVAWLLGTLDVGWLLKAALWVPVLVLASCVAWSRSLDFGIKERLRLHKRSRS